MKEIKPVHIVIAIILILLSLAIFQWINLPKSAHPEAVSSEAEVQPETLPVLPQNERYNSVVTPDSPQDLSLFEESARQNQDAPKDPAMSNQKPML